MNELILDLDQADEMDPILDWEGVFGNVHPVEIEIGSGKGRFLIESAQRHPKVNFVGVEWARKYLRIAHERSLKRELGNIRLVRAEAREFIEFFVPTESTQAFHIYFPDPWPKKRHHKRRLFNPRFLKEVERTLMPGGWLWLATDYRAYYEAISELLAGSDCLRETCREWKGTKTNYEEKYLAQGREIYRRTLKKCSGALH